MGKVLEGEAVAREWALLNRVLHVIGFVKEVFFKHALFGFIRNDGGFWLFHLNLFIIF